MRGLLGLFEVLGKEHVCPSRSVGERARLLKYATIAELAEERIVCVNNRGVERRFADRKNQIFDRRSPCADPRQRAPQPVSIVLTVRNIIRTSSQGEKYLM